jgi:hypothetical protein
MGRPSDYTPELADAICDKLSNGQSLRSICLADDMPDKRTVFRWLRQHQEFCHQYARAKEESADVLADEILDIADDGTGDMTVDQEGNERVNNENIQRSRLRVDARKWIASKLKPKKYGDKAEIEHSGTMNHKVAGRIELVALDADSAGKATE